MATLRERMRARREAERRKLRSFTIGVSVASRVTSNSDHRLSVYWRALQNSSTGLLVSWVPVDVAFRTSKGPLDAFECCEIPRQGIEPLPACSKDRVRHGRGNGRNTGFADACGRGTRAYDMHLDGRHIRNP